MKCLLDTHTLLWSIYDTKKLSSSATKMLMDNNIEKFVSVVTVWEIAIKSRIGKIKLKKGVNGIYNEIENNGFALLGIDQKHIEIYNTLPLHHRDPFDGMIVATAMAMNMTVLTCDADIQKYNIKWVW